MLCFLSTLEVLFCWFRPTAAGSPWLANFLCAMLGLALPLPELSWIKFANEISRIPRVRVADRPRFPPPSAVLGPVHASAPRKIHYALSVRHWRHLLDGVDHSGVCRHSATFHQLASLMPKLRVRIQDFASSAIRSQLVSACVETEKDEKGCENETRRSFHDALTPRDMRSDSVAGSKNECRI